MNYKKLLIILLIFISIILFSNMASADNYVYYGTGNGELYQSNNGINKLLLFNNSIYNITDISTSSSGKYINSISCKNNNVTLIYSNDFGIDFTLKNISYICQGSYTKLVTSDNGQYIYIITGISHNPPYIFRSSDFGVTFTNVSMSSIGFNNNLAAISISGDGSKVAIVGSVGGGVIYYSTNYGVSFTNYQALSVGSYVDICTDGTEIYATINIGGTQLKRINVSLNLSNPMTTVFSYGASVPSINFLTSCNNNHAIWWNKTTSNNFTNSTSITPPAYIFKSSQNLTLIYTYYSNILYHSTDYGVTWNNSLNNSIPITSISVLTASFNTTDGFYHNYCYYNVKCHNYNISSDTCDDYPLTICAQAPLGGDIYLDSCSDTFDTYKSAGLENVTPSFSAECYNNMSIVKYPEIEGYVSNDSYNICIGDYICRHMTMNWTTQTISCPLFDINNVSNKIYCPSYTGNLYSVCSDNSLLFGGNSYPTNFDYGAKCYLPSSDCFNIGSTRCKTNSTVAIETCTEYHNATMWIYNDTCNDLQVCKNGLCELKFIGKSENTTISEGEFSDTMNNIPIQWKYIIMLIIVIIFLLAPMAMAGKEGVLAGLVLSSIICISFTILFGLSLLIPIVYVLLSAGVITILIRSVFVN